MSVPKVLKRIENPRDPPGQRSVYILPGDHREQTYRLLTFKDYPNSDVDVYSLSRQGFYFTGFKDRVKCFSCAIALENLSRDVGSDFSRYHRQDCEFVNGNTSHSSPLHAGSSSSYSQQSQTLNPMTTQTPVTAGEVLRSPTTPGLPFLSASTFRRNSPPLVNSASTTSHTGSTNQSIPRSNLELFPCRQPINPHMRNCEARLQTFAERATNWPAHRINATPREITEAGFFYLGERDRVKCWYCNGGLQNWEREDQPWEEHAKWFPMCEFLLQQKGAQFVHQIVSSTPNLRRPLLANPARNIDFTNARRNSMNDPRYSTTSASSGPEIIDPRAKQNEQRQKIEQEMSSSELVKQARLMGFEDETILAALRCQYQEHDSGFSTFESMVDALLLHENDNNDGEEEVEVSTSPKEPQVPANSREELKQLVDSRKCKVCHEEDACIVLVPCGHLATCKNCGDSVNRCPICRSFIKERIRSYLA